MADAAELEGLDKVIAWVKNIYIFGLFEGETGEEAPWYLKPVRLPLFFYGCWRWFCCCCGIVGGGVVVHHMPVSTATHPPSPPPYTYSSMRVTDHRRGCEGGGESIALGARRRLSSASTPGVPHPPAITVW